jgi:hypothetical protein
VRSTIRSCASWISAFAFDRSGRDRYFRRHSENFVDEVVCLK